MRTHELLEGYEGDETDHLLFWPIGQQMLAEIVRQLLDKRLAEPEKPDKTSVKKALKWLGKLEWRLHQPPWRHFLLIRDDKNRWKLRSEERKEAVRVGRRLQQWIIGLDELDATEVEELKLQWASRLVPAQTEQEVNQIWQKVVTSRSKLMQQT